MTANAAEALELALWLHRSPARRAALLGRPLPDGIGQLLRVASGARDQVAAAATIAGQDEATVLEAVRFYLQQVLFHDEADAYRVLGLDPDASHAQAREHHRLLQQWLHPDRNGEDAWESVYAVRINQAWSQLRTPQGRAAYDASLAATAGVPSGGFTGGDYQDQIRTVPSPLARGSRSRSRNLTLMALLGCAGLLVLIAVRQENPPQWSDDRTPAVDVDLSEVVGVPVFEAASEPSAPTVASPPSPSPPLPTSPAPPALVQASAPTSTSTPTSVARHDVAPVPATVPTAGTRPESPALPARSDSTAARPVPTPSTGVAELSGSRQVDPPVVPVAPAPVAPRLAIEQPVPIQVPDAFDRMAQAQARTRAVLGYLRDPGAGLPPVWNDVGTMQHAEAIRTALHDRQGRRRGLPVELQAPQWRLSADGARLESRYRAGAEQGRLDLAFTWRENQLLVTDISLEPDA